jgi:cation diffusion facilitator CzcD-associated flavoprotein CzcO
VVFSSSTLFGCDSGLAAPNVIVATGFADWPYRPHWLGEELFGGDIRHSSAYRNTAPYKGKRVLVAGIGNSGGEIAFDLAEAGVEVALSVRGPVNIVPREIFGIPSAHKWGCKASPFACWLSRASSPRSPVGSGQDSPCRVGGYRAVEKRRPLR